VGLVWVTGISGSGKSSVCAALKDQGHRAIDADWEGFNHWVHRLTGEVIVDPPDPVPPGWLEHFAWRICVDRVRSLAAAASSSVTFLCGSVENEVDVWQYFDRVVCLVADDETIRQRLATRTTNEFGKHPEELAAALGWNKVVGGRYRELGASVIDAARPLAEVVSEVLDVARPG
jgi:hypothetical protein